MTAAEISVMKAKPRCGYEREEDLAGLLDARKLPSAQQESTAMIPHPQPAIVQSRPLSPASRAVWRDSVTNPPYRNNE